MRVERHDRPVPRIHDVPGRIDDGVRRARLDDVDPSREAAPESQHVRRECGCRLPSDDAVRHEDHLSGWHRWQPETVSRRGPVRVGRCRVRCNVPDESRAGRVRPQARTGLRSNCARREEAERHGQRKTPRTGSTHGHLRRQKETTTPAPLARETSPGARSGASSLAGCSNAKKKALRIARRSTFAKPSQRELSIAVRRAKGDAPALLRRRSLRGRCVRRRGNARRRLGDAPRRSSVPARRRACPTATGAP